MDKTRELSYNELIENLTQLSSLHPVIDFSYIGNSILDRPIPLITLGDKNAEKSVLYVGTHHACENICTSVLLRFINEYIGAYERFGQICQINMHYLNKMRKIHIVPMLNPDGVEYRLHGLENNNPIKDRVIAYNEGNDFSKWQSNARGVDLNHNYNAYFEEYKEIERARGITNGKTKAVIFLTVVFLFLIHSFLFSRISSPKSRSIWRDEIAKTYKRYNDVMSSKQGSYITEHEFMNSSDGFEVIRVDDGTPLDNSRVVRVEYANGEGFILNYNSYDVVVSYDAFSEPVVIKGLNFASYGMNN